MYLFLLHCNIFNTSWNCFDNVVFVCFSLYENFEFEFEFWCLTLLSVIFQLYHGNHVLVVEEFSDYNKELQMKEENQMYIDKIKIKFSFINKFSTFKNIVIFVSQFSS
jgi:hypothetical protein